MYECSLKFFKLRLNYHLGKQFCLYPTLWNGQGKSKFQRFFIKLFLDFYHNFSGKEIATWLDPNNFNGMIGM